MKLTVIWDVATRCLAESDRRFRGAYCLHLSIPEMPFNLCETTRRSISEDGHLCDQTVLQQLPVVSNDVSS
jgi:hypothetical protein